MADQEYDEFQRLQEAVIQGYWLQKGAQWTEVQGNKMVFVPHSLWREPLDVELFMSVRADVTDQTDVGCAQASFTRRTKSLLVKRNSLKGAVRGPVRRVA